MVYNPQRREGARIKDINKRTAREFLGVNAIF
jgi:hypothetical protein